jgi:membrane associated rhomboid family serine protease
VPWVTVRVFAIVLPIVVLVEHFVVHKSWAYGALTGLAVGFGLAWAVERRERKRREREAS